MARQLRHHVPGGWYHITTRGLGRRRIFETDRDHGHFLELLSGMVERYSIIVHAYVLLVNHYHILMESPEGNVSQAMQWLNTSYSVWFNIKHDRVGALFQYRFKSIPVDNEGSWAFQCAMYVHLNPVRIKGLGLGKEERALEKKGMLPKEPEPELLLKRLEVLRTYRWSSYPAYAGYVEKPAWLHCDEIWWRGNERRIDPQKAYRDWLEDYIKQGAEEKVFTRFSKALAIGSTEFVAKIRNTVLKKKVTNSNEREWRRLLPFEDVIKAVESVKGEPWSDFMNRHGDWSRDMALYVGRLRCGLTLQELGGYTGMQSQAVCQGTLRVKRRL
ncbi:MAG: transposase, partial [Saccharofermentanales bacterium]